MSDCSIEAMKPKEPPKTCGHTLVEELHMVQQNCRYERELSETDSFYCYDITGRFFDLHIVEKAEELEQRCQQLEQVAREMYKEILHCEEDNGGWWHNSSDFREQLEALEVGLDD